MYTPINQYIERLENISFDVDKLNEAVSELIKIRPFENSNKSQACLSQMLFALIMMRKSWMNGLEAILEVNIGQTRLFI